MISVVLPCVTVSTLNAREHWATRAKRAKRQRADAQLVLRGAFARAALPCVVTLTRLAARELDGDNLAGALKSVRDGVADWLGVDDRDRRVTWICEQERAKAPGVRIAIAG